MYWRIFVCKWSLSVKVESLWFSVSETPSKRTTGNSNCTVVAFAVDFRQLSKINCKSHYCKIRVTQNNISLWQYITYLFIFALLLQLYIIPLEGAIIEKILFCFSFWVISQWIQMRKKHVFLLFYCSYNTQINQLLIIKNLMCLFTCDSFTAAYFHVVYEGMQR